MQLVSDVILEDRPQADPTFEAIYPRYDDFQFWNPSAWTSGHPHELFTRMRDQAPVMWRCRARSGSTILSAIARTTAK